VNLAAAAGHSLDRIDDLDHIESTTAAERDSDRK
jgi:hypothetical protein